MRQTSQYIGKANLYEEDKISFDCDLHIQDWYGVKQGKEKLVCAKCGGTHESKGIVAIHGNQMLELIYICECGNIMVSRTYGIKPGKST